MNIETTYSNVRTMGEAVKDSSVPDKQTEESV